MSRFGYPGVFVFVCLGAQCQCVLAGYLHWSREPHSPLTFYLQPVYQGSCHPVLTPCYWPTPLVGHKTGRLP
ncbi:hypothetical protein EDB92DRAFT_1913979, partial [Lactarius akahatsu]